MATRRSFAVFWEGGGSRTGHLGRRETATFSNVDLKLIDLPQGFPFHRHLDAGTESETIREQSADHLLNSARASLSG
jgi:hypothetical protein